MKKHVDDMIWSTQEFLLELKKIENRYYNKIEKMMVNSEQYSIKNLQKEVVLELGRPLTIIKNKKDLKEYFFQYMYDVDSYDDFFGDVDSYDDFFGYILDHQRNCDVQSDIPVQRMKNSNPW
jgi:hypothetical protein